VNFVIHYDEGSEYNLHDDGFSEATADGMLSVDPLM